jgi:N-acetylmuramoyl-L-alanine amidase
MLVIDAGHGGKDTGAIYRDRVEKDFNLVSARYLFDRFKELGVEVTLTRDNDVTLDNDIRIQKAMKGDICLSCHLNALDTKRDGAEVIHSIFADGKFAHLVRNEWEKVGQSTKVYSRSNDRGTDYYYMHRLTGKTQTLILEFCYLDNDKDFQHFMEHMNEYYEGVIRAYCLYVDRIYTPPTLKPANTDLYFVQIGAFNNRENAENVLEHVKSLGYNPFIKKETPRK